VRQSKPVGCHPSSISTGGQSTGGLLPVVLLLLLCGVGGVVVPMFYRFRYSHEREGFEMVNGFKAGQVCRYDLGWIRLNQVDTIRGRLGFHVTVIEQDGNPPQVGFCTVRELRELDASPMTTAEKVAHCRREFSPYRLVR